MQKRPSDKILGIPSGFFDDILIAAEAMFWIAWLFAKGIGGGWALLLSAITVATGWRMLSKSCK